MPKRHLDLFELCVWAYQAQRVDVVTGRGLFEAERDMDEDGRPSQRSSTCGCVAIADIARVGGRIDGGKHAGLNTRVHPDAVVLADLVRDDIIIFHAKIGDAPEWPMTLPRAWPEVADRGCDAQWGWIDVRRYRNAAAWRAREAITADRVEYRILVAERISEPYVEREWDGYRRRFRDRHLTRTVEVPYCPLSWSPSVEWIMSQQGTYRRWHEAMTRLAEQVAGLTLRDHAVTGFGAATYW